MSPVRIPGRGLYLAARRVSGHAKGFALRSAKRQGGAEFPYIGAALRNLLHSAGVYSDRDTDAYCVGDWLGSTRNHRGSASLGWPVLSLPFDAAARALS